MIQVTDWEQGLIGILVEQARKRIKIHIVRSSSVMAIKLVLMHRLHGRTCRTKFCLDTRVSAPKAGRAHVVCVVCL